MLQIKKKQKFKSGLESVSQNSSSLFWFTVLRVGGTN